MIMNKTENNFSRQYKKQIAAVIVILLSAFLGIGSRSAKFPLPDFFKLYTGDTMWALAFYAFFTLLLCRSKQWTVFSVTLAFSILIEVSQLWHPSWLEYIRNYKLGGLLLGYGFHWSDLICYTCGCCLGALIFSLIKNSNTNSDN